MEQQSNNNIPIRKDKDIEIKTLEIETVNRVISEEDLKTQFSPDERLIITALQELSNKPFQISKKIAENRGIKFNQDNYKYPVLESFLKQYCRKGKALDRKGIGEDVDVVSAYFQAQIEREKTKQNQSSILTK